MELKRYTLTTENKIHETKQKEYGLLGDFLYTSYLGELDYFVGVVTKTSNNIIELLLKDDLVETDKNYIFKVYKVVNSGCYNDRKEYVDNKDITAIYKRQSNGDYKRYEIGCKE